jgi:hypothetical protein
VVTIRDGVATSEGDYIYTEEAMVDKMLNSILNANKKINLDALSQDCKMKVLHKFFKAANKPEMSVLINNVVAQYL